LAQNYTYKGWDDPHQPFFLSENWMNGPSIWYMNVGSRLFRFITKHAFDRQTHRRTDGRTDRQKGVFAVAQ